MPIREFRCDDCGHVFEILILGASEEDDLRCPQCGAGRLNRLFSVFGVAGVEKQTVSSKSCGSCSTHSCSTCS
ncbi:MAG: zinc ribbon domain-containing protein [candidate division WOR-3 bacterium]|nr:MAG: zinc ribbon domain-containing protein [candidate division WOR-3 bacterium]